MYELSVGPKKCPHADKNPIAMTNLIRNDADTIPTKELLDLLYEDRRATKNIPKQKMTYCDTVSSIISNNSLGISLKMATLNPSKPNDKMDI